MECPNGDNKTLFLPHHERCVMNGKPRELHRDCANCGDVFILRKEGEKLVIVKRLF